MTDLKDREDVFLTGSRRILSHVPHELVRRLEASGFALVPNMDAWINGSIATIAKRLATSIRQTSKTTGEQIAAVTSIIEWMVAVGYLELQVAKRGARYVLGDRARGEINRASTMQDIRRMREASFTVLVRHWINAHRPCWDHPEPAEWASPSHPYWSTTNVGCGRCAFTLPTNSVEYFDPSGRASVREPVLVAIYGCDRPAPAKPIP